MDQQNPQQDLLFDRKSAAKYLSVSPATLAVWDSTKRYDLQPIKMGSRAIRYRQSSLDAFLKSQMKEI